ncbi:MAG TPA: hypothetical protein VKT32_03990, partial [Chthonomonadaceae bacterium]|nr:hypothetical protein [Chthonomonadaceae bacterium]
MVTPLTTQLPSIPINTRMDNTLASNPDLSTLLSAVTAPDAASNPPSFATHLDQARAQNADAGASRRAAPGEDAPSESSTTPQESAKSDSASEIHADSSARASADNASSAAEKS